MVMKRILFILLPWTLLILTSVFLWKQCQDSTPVLIQEDQVVINHHMVVEKMESLGKLELVKYYIKDIVEHEVIKDWQLDPKVVLIVSGEVVGCINLTKIDSNHIQIEMDKITVKLPQPELCYFKINHKESKVHSMEKDYFTESSELVDTAYKMAEKQIEVAAIKMKILEQTKVNSEIFLRPFLEELTGKKVIFTY